MLRGSGVLGYPYTKHEILLNSYSLFKTWLKIVYECKALKNLADKNIISPWLKKINKIKNLAEKRQSISSGAKARQKFLKTLHWSMLQKRKNCSIGFHQS